MAITQPSDRRNFGRRDSALHAVAMVSGRGPAHCVVRNFSERGALLEFTEPFAPTYRFRLIVESKNVDVMCEVRHQGQHSIGVNFISGSSAGLFEVAASGRAEPMPQPPSVKPLAQARATRTSGTDLRSSLFGDKNAAEIVRSFDADAGGIIRGSRMG